MTKTKGVSPKLAAAIGAPLTAVVTAMILTNEVDRVSLAALAAILIGAALGYHAPRGAAVTATIAPPSAPPATGSAASAGGPPPMWTTATSSHITFSDTDEDGDDHLPGDLADRIPDPAPVDEVNVADLNHPEVN